VCQKAHHNSSFKYVQRFSSRICSIIVALPRSEKRKDFRESIFGKIYMSTAFLQGVLKMFIVKVSTSNWSNWRVAVKATHKTHAGFRLIFLFLVYDTIDNCNNSRNCFKPNIYFRYNTFFESQVVKWTQADRQTDGWIHLRRVVFVSCIIQVIFMSVGGERKKYFVILALISGTPATSS